MKIIATADTDNAIKLSMLKDDLRDGVVVAPRHSVRIYVISDEGEVKELK